MDINDKKLNGEILAILSNNAKITTEELAVMLGMPKETIENAISSMEKEGIILGYRTLINKEKIDDNYVCAYIELKVTPEQGSGFDKTANDIISKYPFVKSVFLMSGGFDLLVVVDGLDMKEIALFVMQNLAPLDNVISTSTHFVLKTYKKNGKVIDEIKKDERYGVSF